MGRRESSAQEQGSNSRSKAVRNPDADAYQLTNPGPNKFILLNNNGIPQHSDYISVTVFPTSDRPCGMALYYDESGTADELTFTWVQVLRPVSSRIVTQACHTSSGQIFQLAIVVDSSGTTAFLMHCGDGDIAHFERADLLPAEDLYSYEEGELYTTDCVWVIEMESVEFL